MDKQKKVFQTKIEDIDPEERTMVFTLSDSSIDRDNEILQAKGAHWGEGKQMPPFLFAHRHDILPIGKFLWIKRVKNDIIGKVQFAPTDFAMSSYVLYQGNYINAVSVGFLPDKNGWEDNVEIEGKTVNRVYNKWEILEASAVPVGSNRNAIQNDYESGKLKIAEAVYKSFGFEEKKTKEEPEKPKEEPAKEPEGGAPRSDEETEKLLLSLEPKLKELGLILKKKSEEEAEKESEEKSEPAKPEGNEIDLENMTDSEDIDISKMEVPETGLENLDKDFDITEEQYQKLLTGIEKVISDGLVREFRIKVLGEIVD